MTEPLTPDPLGRPSCQQLSMAKHARRDAAREGRYKTEPAASGKYDKPIRWGVYGVIVVAGLLFAARVLGGVT